MDIPKIGLHIDEAVEVSGIGRTNLYAAIRDGRLKARKHGRRTVIISDDLKAFLLSLPQKEIAREATRTTRGAS
ncbi:helix-turn-helix domain-containing protein [Sinorhizobium garamanticum]|uniref:Helix-turn-helix domain-containing protein n=1 Tax=Sinorhizobium garamanticum TaxID=680247 RepID=A0ABY8D8G5_9HYPH|nr:helix-turn-helix domain-containing protein [Sinorhizobium garamanticum]WEX87186.1 helix-turn-helix domain-containing protein [Sinorhizobium garamanticum]